MNNITRRRKFKFSVKFKFNKLIRIIDNITLSKYLDKLPEFEMPNLSDSTKLQDLTQQERNDLISKLGL